MAQEPTARIFEKVVDGETQTRTVTSESSAVAARFDGFFEKGAESNAAQKADLPAAPKGSAKTGGSGNAANNAG